jgi:hypothetical protein
MASYRRHIDGVAALAQALGQERSAASVGLIQVARTLERGASPFEVAMARVPDQTKQAILADQRRQAPVRRTTRSHDRDDHGPEM